MFRTPINLCDDERALVRHSFSRCHFLVHHHYTLNNLIDSIETILSHKYFNQFKFISTLFCLKVIAFNWFARKHCLSVCMLFGVIPTLHNFFSLISLGIMHMEYLVRTKTILKQSEIAWWFSFLIYEYQFENNFMKCSHTCSGHSDPLPNWIGPMSPCKRNFI